LASLKIVYPICCGVDVHRDFLVACIASTDQLGITTYESKRFSTYSGSLREFGKWLLSRGCADVCMESTGKYWFPVHNILVPLGLNVVVCHPKFVKAIKGKKTDKKDAQWISDLFKHDLVRGSFIPPEDIRQLRDLCRYWCKLTYCATGEKNRAQNCLTASNFKLDDVFSDVFGKSATAIIDQLLIHAGESFDVAPYVHKNCKTPAGVIQAAADGAFPPEQAAKMQIIRRHIDNIARLKAELESIILRLAEPYLPQIEFLLTVPGIREPMTAIRIVAEIGADMSVFESARHLASWAGLAPQNNESAGKKKTTRVGKAGAYIKPILVQAALAASRSKANPEISSKFQALKKRRGGKKACIAIARRLLTAIYHMLLKNEEYNGALYQKAEKIPEKREVTAEQAFAILRKQGFLIKGVDSAIGIDSPSIEVSA
jgi:transposase